MAIVAAPIMPLRLFRYRNVLRGIDAFEQEVESILGNTLYCSEFHKMNDPMEGFFIPSARIAGNNNYKNAMLRITDRKNRIGIACFSETHEDVLMWTHYAGNHQGFCVAYSTRRLTEGLPISAEIVRVGYVDAPPRITSEDLKNTSVAARKILSQKRYSWAYEREWRVLADPGLNEIEGSRAVMAVYLGSRIDPKIRHRLLQRIKGTPIKAFAMTITDYNHEWEAVNAAAKA